LQRIRRRLGTVVRRVPFFSQQPAADLKTVPGQAVSERTSPTWEVGVPSTRSSLAGGDGRQQNRAGGQHQRTDEAQRYFFPVQQPQQQAPRSQQVHPQVADVELVIVMNRLYTLKLA